MENIEELNISFLDNDKLSKIIGGSKKSFFDGIKKMIFIKI